MRRLNGDFSATIRDAFMGGEKTVGQTYSDFCPLRPFRGLFPQFLETVELCR
jgi:hypothetical protein